MLSLDGFNGVYVKKVLVNSKSKNDILFIYILHDIPTFFWNWSCMRIIFSPNCLHTECSNISLKAPGSAFDPQATDTVIQLEEGDKIPRYLPGSIHFIFCCYQTLLKTKWELKEI